MILRTLLTSLTQVRLLGKRGGRISKPLRGLGRGIRGKFHSHHREVRHLTATSRVNAQALRVEGACLFRKGTLKVLRFGPQNPPRIPSKRHPNGFFVHDSPVKGKDIDM